MDNKARKKVDCYLVGYAIRNGTTFAFLPCVMSTSLLWENSWRIKPSYNQNEEFCASSTSLPTTHPEIRCQLGWGVDEPGVDFFNWHKSQSFWQHRAAMELATAVAVAHRAHLLCVCPSIDPCLSQTPFPHSSLTVALSSCVTTFRYGPGLL